MIRQSNRITFYEEFKTELHKKHILKTERQKNNIIDIGQSAPRPSDILLPSLRGRGKGGEAAFPPPSHPMDGLVGARCLPARRNTPIFALSNRN